MKHIIQLCFVSLLLLLTACKKDNYSLPSETQTGANTFGCKINGKVWVPGGSDANSGQNITAFYQFIYPSPVGFVFHVSGTNYEKNPLETVSISSDSIKLQNGLSISLANQEKGKTGRGMFWRAGSIGQVSYSTTSIFRGQIEIKKFDEINQIVAGTFWFDAKNQEGEVLHITEGRFDVKFTR